MDLKELKEQAEKLIRKHATPRNILIVLSLFAILLFTTILLLKHSSEPEFAVLYTKLSPDDAGEIISVLQEERVPYKITGDGSIILVPKDMVYTLRLKLASKGLPHGKSVGFEIFKEPKLGITQFQERMEYLMALEGELERTIKRIDAVKEVKVNIALPKESIFMREEEEPKASVLITLWEGKDLTPEQVKAIVFLVSHAVPKLKPENVSVIDNRGRVLSEVLKEKDELGTSKELEIKRKLEREIERKVQTMLSAVLGSDKVVVRASVEIETGKVETHKEIYDPEKTAVVSQRKIQEKEKRTKPKPQGVPGSTTNIPPVIDLTPNEIISEREKKDITTNYDVSKTIERAITPVFRIKRITVGVLVDGKYEIKTDKEGNRIIKFVPRSEEEIKTYENIVKSAIGYDPKRGDVVTVASVPFEAREIMKAVKEEKPIPWYYFAVFALLFMSLAGFLAFKMMRKEVPELPPELPPEEMIVEMREKAEEEMKEIHIEQDPVYLKIVEIGRDFPELLANIVSKWIKEGGFGK